MYKGRKQTFELEGKEHILARPGYREMQDFATKVEKGEHITVLLEAAEDKGVLDAALNEADHENVETLIDDFVTYAGYESFTQASLQRQVKLSEAVFTLLKEKGLTEHETPEAYMREKLDSTL